MQTLRHLRRSRALTYLDLAALTNIPARTLAEAEYGLRRLSAGERERLAFVLGLPTHAFTGAHARSATLAQTPARATPQAPALLALALAATLATSALQPAGSFTLPAIPRPAVNSSLPAAVSGALADLPLPAAPADLAAAVREATVAELRARAAVEPEAFSPALAVVPVDRPLPVPVVAPPFTMTTAGPRGCPVQTSAGTIVMTQGYGVGSHAPAAVWGAIDLAIDADGDGYADPGATWYAPVVATHAGQVRVTLNSYPAGNHVWVNDTASPWRTGYAHLAMITVVSGQHVQPGDVIGLIGSTGVSSGPHLDYQVWNGAVNIDPTELVGCGAAA
jgi:murein DD-endopeptidase MepM/ murein hydrolase activator NlpD